MMKYFCLIALAFLNGAHAANPGWDHAAEHRVREAYQLFTESSEEPSASREQLLGEATTLCNLQPVTEENLDRADQILAKLSVPQDAITVAALYLRGRIAQSHRSPSLPDEARQHYAQLVKLGSDQPLAQAGIVHLALLILYDESRPITARFNEAEALATHLQGSFARSDYHLVLARSYLFHEQSDERALAHFAAAIDHGIPLDQIRADALVSAGELARKLNRPDQARRYYAQFLAENPRDSRHPTIQSREEALP